MRSRSRKVRACHKVRHATRRLAEKHAEGLRKRTGSTCWPYVCEFCGGWHVGHTYKAPIYRILNDLDKGRPRKQAGSRTT